MVIACTVCFVVFQHLQLFHQHALPIAMQFRPIAVLAQLVHDALFVRAVPREHAQAAQALEHQ